MKFRCLNTLMKKNYFETSTHLIHEYFSLEPKKLASKIIFVWFYRGWESGSQRSGDSEKAAKRCIECHWGCSDAEPLQRGPEDYPSVPMGTVTRPCVLECQVCYKDGLARVLGYLRSEHFNREQLILDVHLMQNRQVGLQIWAWLGALRECWPQHQLLRAWVSWPSLCELHQGRSSLEMAPPSQADREDAKPVPLVGAPWALRLGSLEAHAVRDRRGLHGGTHQRWQ